MIFNVTSALKHGRAEHVVGRATQNELAEPQMTIATHYNQICGLLCRMRAISATRFDRGR